MKSSKQGLEKYKLFSLRRKRILGRVMLEPSPVLKEIKTLKENPDVQWDILSVIEIEQSLRQQS